MTKRAGILLAGGKAKRFQEKQGTWQDKALAELLGKPLIVHAVENLCEVVEEIVICVNDESRKVQYLQVLAKSGIVNVRLLVDEKIDHLGGPLVAIYTGLKAVEAEFCITLPGDMPMIQPAVIEYMFSEAKDSRVVVPMWPNGRLETLNMVLERDSALEIARTLCQLKRPRSDDMIRGALKVMFISTVGELMQLDPELKSFVNINSREDLARLQPRCVDGPLTQNLRLNWGSLPLAELQSLREAGTFCQEGKLVEASRAFSSCAVRFEKEELFFWAALSRENEGKSLLSGFKNQSKSELSSEQIASGKNSLLEAAKNYELEAKVHEKCGCIFLSERARSDMLWCESRVKKF
jgi:molybdopterin-guanine dinucleotide biosynthesis protein A